MNIDGRTCRGTERGGFVLLTLLVLAAILSLLLTTALTARYRLHADSRRAMERLRAEAEKVTLERD